MSSKGHHHLQSAPSNFPYLSAFCLLLFPMRWNTKVHSHLVGTHGLQVRSSRRSVWDFYHFQPLTLQIILCAALECRDAFIKVSPDPLSSHSHQRDNTLTYDARPLPTFLLHQHDFSSRLSCRRRSGAARSHVIQTVPFVFCRFSTSDRGAFGGHPGRKLKANLEFWN